MEAFELSRQRLECEVMSTRRKPEHMPEHAALEGPDVNGIRVRAQRTTHDGNRLGIVQAALAPGERGMSPFDRCFPGSSDNRSFDQFAHRE